jgi:hypothetical protein
MDHGSLPKEEGSTSLQAAATQVVIWSSRRQWLAIIGVMFILAAAFALGFFWPHAADKPRPGRLAVNTVPDNAEVWLDGISQGKTPMVLEFFAPGDRQLKVELPAINEIYARHGAPFLSEPEIEKQFRGFEWYHPDRDLKLSQIEASFSAIEKKNVDILARLRDQKRPR